MSYKNTMKLFVSNFALAWKHLVYLFCCAILFALCTYTLVAPVIEVFRTAGLGVKIKDFFSVLYNSPASASWELSNLFELIGDAITSNFSAIYLNIIGTIIFCVILPYILIQMSIYNMSSILYQKFTMNMEVSYIKNHISKLGASIKFAFANLIIGLPYAIVSIGLIILYILFSTSLLKSIIGLAVLSLCLIILDSIKITFTSHYVGSVVAENQNPFKSFSKSLKPEFKYFGRITGQAIIVTLTVVLINGVIAIFTFFAGLIFTIPATMMLISIYKVVIYLNINENRYYLSDSVIYNPLKYVVKKDDYVATFTSPEEIKEITTTKMKKKYPKKPKEEKIKKEKTKKVKKTTKTTKSKKLKG